MTYDVHHTAGLAIQKCKNVCDGRYLFDYCSCWHNQYCNNFKSDWEWSNAIFFWLMIDSNQEYSMHLFYLHIDNEVVVPLSANTKIEKN